MADYLHRQIGNYRIEQFLGRGGFADVYLASHLHLKRQIAIKVLHLAIEGRERERFAQEAQIVVDLRHPHIITILDFGFDDQTPYLMMDYVSGGSLRAKHPRGAQLPLAQVVAYTRQAADALQYAHNHHIIHQDVKPENMLLSERGELILADFGLALIQESAASLSTQNGAGTPCYMAPEQLRGKPCFASDQYALAICVYEWLCGTVPFRGAIPIVCNHHLHSLPPPLRQHVPDLASGVEDVVLKALSKEAKQRFPNVQAFTFALEQAALAEKPARAEAYMVSGGEATIPMDATPPSPSSAHLPPVKRFLPGLDEIDNQVMKLLCDEAMQGGHYWVNAQSLVERAKDLDIPETEFFDSLRVLARKGYLEVKEAMGGSIGLVKIRVFGFECYARAYIERYPAIMEAIIDQILSEGPNGNTDLAHALGQREMIISHILQQLAREKLIDIVETMGRENNIHVYNVSPELRRRKKGPTQ